MSVRHEMLNAPVVPLRYLVEINPRPIAIQEATSVYLPMEAISGFGPADTNRRRPTDELQQGYSYIANGDVAYAKVTPCFENGKGIVAVDLPDGYAFATTEVTVLRPGSMLDKAYLGWHLQSEAFLTGGEANMTGSGGLRRVPDTFTLTYTIPVPPRAAQRAIADYLDRETARIDTLIDEQQRLIEMLRDRRVATVAEALDGYEQTQLRRLVDHDRPMTYGILQCGEPIDGGVVYIGPSDILGEGVSPDRDALRTTAPEIASAYKRSALEGGDVVVSIGPAYGKVAVVSNDLAGANLTQDTVRVALRPDLADTRFIVWALMSRQTAEYWDYQIMGATFRRLNLGTLARTPIPLPAAHEQRRIAAYLDEQTAKIDMLITEAERFIELSRERRSALITAAVTGQIDVREAA
ncbi:restriction endonuclease subunit S [Streptomyces sp. NPDC048448]|uniref:restriction endonuclease subunit S n=1 Tax=Streptomyces sp. NPDC048448 TaxID=3365554 RepID=UPI003712C976